MARLKDLEKKKAESLKREIRASIVKQVIKPTFNKGAWQVAKEDGATVKPVQNVLKGGGFDKSAWQQLASPAMAPQSTGHNDELDEGSVVFDKSAWMPKNG